ncbi:MAG: cyclodeaminase/cyclohydrolase family protein [Clostridiales bacterium]|nr:cyclodeaminase/cyclohydrolase family protein [Clostridiales bacterium]
MTEGQRIADWVDALASKAPTPGGGGASALGGALAAALGQMVANLTVGKKRYADVEEEMQESLAALAALQADFLKLADRDAEVFASLAAAYGLPSGTDEEKAEKTRVLEENLLAASLVPLKMMEKAVAALYILEGVEAKGSRMAVSDAGVAAQFARAALTGAVMNVYINTKSMKDRERAEELNARSEALVDEGVRLADGIYGRVLAKLR